MKKLFQGEIMPRMIRVDCPECKQSESLVVAFGEPYRDFGDGADDADFRTVTVAQKCACDLEDDERAEGIVYEWNRECYPYQIKGEWYQR
jgi:hypothetical protein